MLQAAKALAKARKYRPFRKACITGSGVCVLEGS
jgi:hypothetical protein